LQYEVKKPKGANPKKEFSKTTAFAFNTKKKEEPLIKKFDVIFINLKLNISFLET